MRRSAAAFACGLAVAALAGCGRAGQEDGARTAGRGADGSTYTSIATDACRAPEEGIRLSFEARGLGVHECAGAGVWRVLLVSSNERSWLELRSPGIAWSSEDAIVYDSPIGLFPGVSDGERLEWRSAADGEPSALIFNVTAQDAERPASRISRFFVAYLGEGGPCLIDRAPSRDAAVAVADAARGCEMAR